MSLSESERLAFEMDQLLTCRDIVRANASAALAGDAQAYAVVREAVDTLLRLGLDLDAAVNAIVVNPQGGGRHGDE